MNTKEKINFEAIKDLLPKRTSLYYVDYNDNLNGQTEVIQTCISDGNLYALYESIDDWYIDSPFYAFEELDKELISDICNKFDIEEEEAKEIFEEFEYEIRDHYINVDDSNVLKDLLSNTSSFITHYDTGYYMDGGSWNWSEAEVRLERIKIKKFLGISSSDYDSKIDMMIMQASGGGQLNIYFEIDDIEDFVLNSKNTINFDNYQIGIVNHYEGSGDILDTYITETTSLPYNNKNVFLEKSIKYNWTYAIAGMCHDWCSRTEYTFSDNVVGTIEESKQNSLNEQDKKYKETYLKGGCTFGDMDYSRHRNKEYINHFPCGNKCKDCGTFWID